MNAYQQYPMVELDKTGTPKPQAPTLSSVTPVQSPFQPPTQPAAAELAPNQLNQQHLIHEIGGAARYPEMATAPARVEMPAAGHQAEMAASTPHPQVATPIQQHIRMEAEPQHIESPDQRPNIPVTETQQVEGDAASVRGQRTGPPQYVMLGGNKVRYYEL
ncbi:hypothetical protein SBRCBS47491_000640 [Sporothrix bragantina]|uniref:Uncharacterized protein n=1 Tax=Sporothrix bragantina TaxID=671064 RepID=A0ABP0AS20_9PEZI